MECQHFPNTTLGQVDMTVTFDNNNQDYNTYKMPSIRLETCHAISNLTNVSVMWVGLCQFYR